MNLDSELDLIGNMDMWVRADLGSDLVLDLELGLGQVKVNITEGLR